MTEAEASTDTANTSLSFAYDASGLRTGKTVTVQTYAETHTVTFVADGETVETLTVEDGYVLQEEDYPAVPEKTGYSGTWTPYTLPVTADITIQASYAPVQHTVTFVADGVTVDTIEVAHGYVLKDSDYPAVPEKPGLYGFWEEYTGPVELDITIQADYQMIQQHTVEFVTSGVLYGQTRVVKSMKVPTGYVLQESDYPEVPPKLGQEGRWKRYTDPIVQDITIHAEYGLPIPVVPTDPYSPFSTGEESPNSGNAAQPISTVTEEHSYIYAGGMLLRETITSGNTTRTLDFRYDNVGYPYALIYNNGSTTATYYYITNLQGDVMYLVDSNGNQVAAYTYDPYGKILSAYGSMAEINPLRYRGYYYDSETGFYYLQSRYYDPNTCRFINADSYASTGQSYLGYNMFAYCNNDPVNNADPTGEFLISLVAMIVISAACTVSLSGCSPQPTSDVGAAQPYVAMPGSDDPMSPNCYAYAIGSPINEQPGGASGRTPTKWNDVNDVGESVEADLIAKGYTVREISGPNEKVYDDEFKIALRVGTQPYAFNPYTGQLYYDYHFMRQTDTGQWAEKHGYGGPSILWDAGMTPDTIPWTLDGVPYYDSEIIYYAVGS